MENWKVALIGGSAGVGTVLVPEEEVDGGIILAGVGLATLASEYPEKFEEVRRRLPDYIERGNSFLEVASRVGDRLAEAAENGSKTGTNRCSAAERVSKTIRCPRVFRRQG